LNEKEWMLTGNDDWELFYIEMYDEERLIWNGAGYWRHRGTNLKTSETIYLEQHKLIISFSFADISFLMMFNLMT
jgi:hypothetical protein